MLLITLMMARFHSCVPVRNASERLDPSHKNKRADVILLLGEIMTSVKVPPASSLNQETVKSSLLRAAGRAAQASDFRLDHGEEVRL